MSPSVSFEDTNQSFSKNFLKDRSSDSHLWKALDSDVPSTIQSIKGLHSFVRDNLETDSKLLMGITGKPQVIHRLLSYAPTIGLQDSHEFFGLCFDDPMGAYLCIPTELLLKIIDPTPISVPVHLMMLSVNSAQEFKESVPTVPTPIPAEETKENVTSISVSMK
jgi:hypothetical protein